MNMGNPDTGLMLSGVVLAGGRGSRIGGDKGLAEVAGRPMLAHVLRALYEVADDVVLAVGQGSRDTYVRTLGPGLKAVEDRAPDRGPLEGLVNALAAVDHGLVAVVPCDVPFLRSDVLRLLAARAAGRDGAVPVVNGFLEPLVAVYKRESGLECFRHELDSGIGKVGNAVRNMGVCRVEESDLRAVDDALLSFWNVNSRDDLAKADDMARRGLITPSSLP